MSMTAAHMDVKEFIRRTNKYYQEDTIEVPNEKGEVVPYVIGTLVRPWALCKDGFILSIQASPTHHCCPCLSPKEIEEKALKSIDPEKDPDWKSHLVYYTEYEVAFQNHTKIPEWSGKYRYEVWNSGERDMNIYYAFVSLEDLEELVRKHDGIERIMEEILS